MMLRLFHKLYLVFCILIIEIVLLAIFGAMAFVAMGLLQLLMSGGSLPSPPITIPSAFAWNDVNRNGKHDTDETSLENVSICLVIDIQNYSDASNCNETGSTSSDGKWASEGYAGRSSSEEFYLIAIPPIGYMSTTSPVIKGTHGEVGFVVIETTSKQNYSIEEIMNNYAEQERQNQFRLKLVYSVIGLIVLSILIYIASLVSDKILSLK